jgi:hypothetical protein
MGTGQIDNMRQAVASGEWPKVLRLWELHAAGIREELARGTCTRARLAEAREFLDWAKRVALCARAQAQSRLNTIYAATQYGSQPSQPRSSLRTSL